MIDVHGTVFSMMRFDEILDPTAWFLFLEYKAVLSIASEPSYVAVIFAGRGRWLKTV